jgi:group I intron endonuclease
MKNNCGIYKIINKKNNKCYIGSSINIKRRWAEHKCNLRKNKHINIHLQKSWNKHGEASFLFEIVELVSNTKDLIIREQYYLDKIKTVNSKIMYNICTIAYSTLGIKYSDTTKNKMSESHKGLIHKKDTIIKMIHIKNKHSENTKSKLSEINKGRISQNKRPIYQIDLNGNIIKQWNSVTDAAKALNLSKSLICSVCRGKRKSTGGFKWQYLNQIKEISIDINEIKNKYSTGLFSTRELSKIYNISKSTIWNMVKA